MTTIAHASLNAILNAIAAGLLLAGRFRIKEKQDIHGHRRVMVLALGASGVFLVSYLVYHAQVGSVPYPWHDWTRPLYFGILVPHIILAAAMLPFIFMALFRALRQEFDHHRKLVRWVWPVWVFVSFSGVAVYLLLYRPWG